MVLLHPMAGSRFAVTMRSIRAHGGVSMGASPAVAIMAVSHGLRYLSCELEILRARRLAASRPPPPDPVFVIGHWRSGTTLMANLLSFDKGFFFPGLVEVTSPHDFFPSPLEKLSRKWLPLLYPEERPADRARMPMRLHFPQEDEMAMAALGAPSFFNAFYFPQQAFDTAMREVFFEGLEGSAIAGWKDTHRHFIHKLALLRPGRRPLLKNPAHTARLPVLREMYPDAKFIMLRRGRDEVVASTYRLFERLWPLLALQRYDLAAVPPLVNDLYHRMEQAIAATWPGLPEEHRFEVEFGKLSREPVRTVKAVLAWLGRPASEQHLARARSYMETNRAPQP